MGISFNRKIHEILESLTGAFRRNLPTQSKAAKHLRHLDVQEMGSMKR